MNFLFIFLLLMSSTINAQTVPDSDPYQWLEEITSERALDWVHQRNAVTAAELESAPNFATLKSRLLSINESTERIPDVVRRGKYFYNFWQDAQHVRGIWRRTTLDEYRKTVPRWETVLDLDALAIKEQENWVWKGADCLHPTYERCLLSLSRGGGDAIVIREFDIERKTFVADGFNLLEAKSTCEWHNKDEIYVSTDFGPGTLTESGYPKDVKRWRRGTPLSSAVQLLAGTNTDTGIGLMVNDQPGFHREIIAQRLTFYTTKYFLIQGEKLRELTLPLDAELQTFRDQLLLQLRSDWQVADKHYPGGALLAIAWDQFLKGHDNFEVLYTPESRGALNSVHTTRNYVLIDEMVNVRSRINVLHVNKGVWQRGLLSIPDMGTATVTPVDDYDSDDYFLNLEDFTKPTSLYMGTLAKSGRELLKALHAFFNADGVQVVQHEAISKDGTRVPYFLVAKSTIALNGLNPTLLYGYGGFEISWQPFYSPNIGSAWLERGGVFVLANIRGGGEFGPQWHQAAIKENRQRAYDDFIAIAEDLIARKVTSPKHLGIMGGSNGGLLMGVMLTQRPDLFGAVVCQVPLLDMKRYNKLLAGASWMDEYGDPDNPDDWAYISRYSPYQNLHADRVYPRVLFTTSTRDDRVHPGHARKMAAAMLAQGHDLLYYENTEGGHSGSANNQQHAYINALEYTFLWQQLK